MNKNADLNNSFDKKNIINRNIANKIYKQIKNEFTWMIYVDVDEFITTRKNISNTIKQELETTFKEYDCIKIPWVMMACNNLHKNQHFLKMYLSCRMIIIFKYIFMILNLF